MHIFGADTTFATTVFLLLALALAFGFEMVNGFHDRANAVATVIYTHALRPTVAVVWSGLMNLLGVLTSSLFKAPERTNLLRRWFVRSYSLPVRPLVFSTVPMTGNRAWDWWF